MRTWVLRVLTVALSATACVHAPEIRDLPRLEARFGAAPEEPQQPEQKSQPPDKTVERAAQVPDPAPTRTRAFVRMNLKFESGRASLVLAVPVELNEETAAARRFGRFALEAMEGERLVERVRFDFPLLAPTDKESRAFEQGLTTKTTVLFPDLSDRTELFLVDGETGSRERFPWPGASVSEDAEPTSDAEAP